MFRIFRNLGALQQCVLFYATELKSSFPLHDWFRSHGKIKRGVGHGILSSFAEKDEDVDESQRCKLVW